MTDKVVFQKLDGTVETRDMNNEEKAVQEEFKQNVINRNKAVNDLKALQESGKQKLLDLGLTEEEVKALIGV